MSKVVKFGGSSLASAAQFRKVGNIIRADKDRIYVVPSAPGKRNVSDTKVTDMLYECYGLAEQGKDFKAEIIRDVENSNRKATDYVREVQEITCHLKACHLSSSGAFSAVRGLTPPTSHRDMPPGNPLISLLSGPISKPPLQA